MWCPILSLHSGEKGEEEEEALNYYTQCCMIRCGIHGSNKFNATWMQSELSVRTFHDLFVPLAHPSWSPSSPLHLLFLVCNVPLVVHHLDSIRDGHKFTLVPSQCFCSYFILVKGESWWLVSKDRRTWKVLKWNHERWEKRKNKKHSHPFSQLSSSLRGYI